MAKSTSIQNSTWLTLLIAAAALAYFAYDAKTKKIAQVAIETSSKDTNPVANNNSKIQREVSALGELSAPVGPSTTLNAETGTFTTPDRNELVIQPDAETDNQTLPPEITSQVGIDPNNIPEDLPEDLKEQLRNPPPLPADLKAQLDAPPPSIPADIQEALKNPPREITIDEVNNPKHQ